MSDSSAPSAPRAGTYHDGRTARSVGAVLRIAGGDLLIETGGGTVRWPLDAVHRIPDGAKGGDARLRLGFDGDERLTVSADADWLFAQCPNLKRTGPPAARRLRAVAVPLVLAAASVVLVVVFVLPRVADMAVAALSAEQERAIGRNARVQVLGLLGLKSSEGTCTGARGLAALSGLVARIETAADLPHPLTVTVADHGLVNALALPGGEIVLFRGLLEKADSAEEVAGVLAHEAGHVQGGHPLHHAIRHAGVAMLVSFLVGDVTGGTVLAGVATAAIGASYARPLEAEADRAALAILTAAGIDARPTAAFFERLRSKAEKSGGPALPSFLDTHPPLPDRETLFATAPPGGPAMSWADWQALQWICRAVEADEDGD